MSKRSKGAKPTREVVARRLPKSIWSRLSFQATFWMTLVSIVLVGVVVAAYANLILASGEVPVRLGAAVFVTLLALLVAGIPVMWAILAWVVHVQWWQQRLLFGRPVLVSEPKLHPGEPQLLVFEGFKPRAQAENLHAMWVFEVGHRNAQNWSNQEQSSAEPLIWSNHPAWFTANQHDKLQAQVTLRPPSNELFYRRTRGDGNPYSRNSGSTRWALLVVTEANLRHKGPRRKVGWQTGQETPQSSRRRHLACRRYPTRCAKSGIHHARLAIPCAQKCNVQDGPVRAKVARAQRRPRGG